MYHNDTKKAEIVSLKQKFFRFRRQILLIAEMFRVVVAMSDNRSYQCEMKYGQNRRVIVLCSLNLKNVTFSKLCYFTRQSGQKVKDVGPPGLLVALGHRPF